MESIVIKTKRTIKEGAKALHHFGWRIASSQVACIWSNESLISTQKKNDAILKYLSREYEKLIERYSSRTEDSSLKQAEDAPLWVFWSQGEDQMPEVIQVCQKSKQMAAGKHPVIVLDQNNIRNYVSFSEDVWELASIGRMKVQHLADMIRVQLIRKYGGLWLDASIFCHRNIPEELFSYPVYSLNGDYNPHYISGNRWTTFLIGGQKSNILCSFLDDFFREWISSGKPFIDYFMFDCAIALAYENIPAVKEEIDALPRNEGDLYWMNKKLGEPTTRELLQEYNEEPSVFYKIGWNRDWEAVKENSFYEFVVKEYRKKE